MNDTLQIIVCEAWLERQWAYGHNEDETTLYPIEGYQLCINTTEKDIQNMNENWMIGLSSSKCMRSSSSNSLEGDLKFIQGDTIKYEVQQGISLSEKEEKIIIGRLVLVRKTVGIK